MQGRIARTEINLAVLRAAAACLRQGDFGALRELGFGLEEIEAVRGLTLDQVDRLADALAEAHVLRVRLDRPAFWSLMARLRAERGREEVQRELLLRGAPQEMMEALYGIGPKRYARLRRGLGAPPGVGRPAEPGESEARRVWQVWAAMGEPTEMPPEDWLALCTRAGVSARTAWRLVARWTARAGDEPAPIGAAAPATAEAAP